MRMHSGLFLASFITGLLATTYAMPVMAERYVPNLEGRLETLENKVSQLAKTGPVATNIATGSVAPMQTKISQIQEEMRQLRGAVEENRHAINVLKRSMTQASEDSEYRFRALEDKAGLGAVPLTDDASAPAGEAAPLAAIPAAPPAITPPVISTPAISTPPTEDALTASPETTRNLAAQMDAITKAPARNTAEMNFSNERDHYNYAVSLVKNQRYDRARDSLQSFLSQHGDSRLTGNAYYWLGETYYVQSNFPAAADEFRRGFESRPDGIKAPDNLYKLSKSLINLGRKDEACVVLAQIQKRYKDRNPEVTGLAFETEKDANCN